MEIKETKIFNLMDTNGRRSDVVNAYQIYLEVLQELGNKYGNEQWDNFPKSTKQILFYEYTLDRSADVFKIHKKYDEFRGNIGEDIEKVRVKDADWIKSEYPKYQKIIDESIEARARHYTSNLVKMGLTTKTRVITEVGYSFLNSQVDRDPLEELLPLDNVNLVLVRQLAKLKIFTESSGDGYRNYYSPFFLALYLLSKEKPIDKSSFATIIQGVSPYFSHEDKQNILKDDMDIHDLSKIAQKMETNCPEEIACTEPLSLEIFRNHFKSSKDVENVRNIYYQFYQNLRGFVWDSTIENLTQLVTLLREHSDYLTKAFGSGKAIFQLATKVDLTHFQKLNKNHPLLQKDKFNKNFHLAFLVSKRVDLMSEYSDTTFRLFAASGVIKLGNLPELAFEDIIKKICPTQLLKEKIFGKMTEEEYLEYEVIENSIFANNLSLFQILNYNIDQVSELISKILEDFGASDIQAASKKIVSRKNNEFIQHLNSKFPEDKVIQILSMFSDRKNDDKIKKEVCESASVPTIYEYIIAIAWYYLSDGNYNLYESMNLTLNGDFQPVIHAGGGAGDIIIHYEKRIVMLEVTLMNKQAQKRGEWEPVLRHSLNLKADNTDKEILTFFIADELDINTINIWRAVAAVPLESTSTHAQVEGVVIMPLTNSTLGDFLSKKVKSEKIIQITKDSFKKVPKITDSNWHAEAISQCLEE